MSWIIYHMYPDGVTTQYFTTATKAIRTFNARVETPLPSVLAVFLYGPEGLINKFIPTTGPVA